LRATPEPGDKPSINANPSLNGLLAAILSMLPSRATLAYVTPFLVFVGIMGLGQLLPIPPGVSYLLRFSLVLLVLLVFSGPVITLKSTRPWYSVAIGIAVFVIWILPDVLFGYRRHWLFDNALTGSAVSSLPDTLKFSPAFVALRALSSTALVPVVEELFWRAWLMRWLIHKNFQKVPLGAYEPSAFWIVAVLFAAEHGPYWEVGLAAGIIYNWWMVRTRSLGDCILAHAVTNGVLAIYVVAAGHWEYWL
jgi:uncharacterized protein